MWCRCSSHLSSHNPRLPSQCQAKVNFCHNSCDLVLIFSLTKVYSHSILRSSVGIICRFSKIFFVLGSLARGGHRGQAGRSRCTVIDICFRRWEHRGRIQTFGTATRPDQGQTQLLSFGICLAFILESIDVFMKTFVFCLFSGRLICFASPWQRYPRIDAGTARSGLAIVRSADLHGRRRISYSRSSDGARAHVVHRCPTVYRRGTHELRPSPFYFHLLITY